MCNWTRTALGSLVLVAASLAPAGAWAQEVGEDEAPDPVSLARASAEFLAAEPAFSFSWFVSFDEVLDGREKLTFLRSGSNLMARDAGFVSLVEDGDRRRDYYFDGEVFTIAAPDEDFYASVPFEGSFEDLVEAARARTGTVVPLWSLMSRRLPERLFEEMDGASYIGSTLVAGQPAHHLAFATYEEDWQIWISTDAERPVPLMIVGTEIHRQGWPQYRAYLTDWDFAPEIAEGAFVHAPDEDDLPVAMPTLVGHRNGGGADAEADADAQEVVE